MRLKLTKKRAKIHQLLEERKVCQQTLVSSFEMKALAESPQYL